MQQEGFGYLFTNFMIIDARWVHRVVLSYTSERIS